MGKKKVDANLRKRVGQDLIREVDCEYQGPEQVLYHNDNPPSGTRATTVREHLDDQQIDRTCPNTLSDTQLASLEGCATQAAFDALAATHLGLWWAGCSANFNIAMRAAVILMESA